MITKQPIQPALPTDRLRIPAHLLPVGTPESQPDTRRAHADNKLGRLAQPVKNKAQKGRTE